MVHLRLDHLDPQTYAVLLNKDGTITLSCRITVGHYTTGETLEDETLTISVSAPDIEDWRAAYEAYYR